MMGGYPVPASPQAQAARGYARGQYKPSLVGWCGPEARKGGSEPRAAGQPAVAKAIMAP